MLTCAYGHGASSSLALTSRSIASALWMVPVASAHLRLECVETSAGILDLTKR